MPASNLKVAHEHVMPVAVCPAEDWLNSYDRSSKKSIRGKPGTTEMHFHSMVDTVTQVVGLVVERSGSSFCPWGPHPPCAVGFQCLVLPSLDFCPSLVSSLPVSPHSLFLSPCILSPCLSPTTLTLHTSTSSFLQVMLTK